MSSSLNNLDRLRVSHPRRLSILREERHSSVEPITDILKDAEAWTLLTEDIFLEFTQTANKAVKQFKDEITKDKEDFEHLKSVIEQAKVLSPNIDPDTLIKQYRAWQLMMSLLTAKMFQQINDEVVSKLCQLLDSSDYHVLFDIITTLVKDIVSILLESPIIAFIRDEIEKVQDIITRPDRNREIANAYISEIQYYSDAIRDWCVLTIMLRDFLHKYPSPSCLDLQRALGEASTRHGVIKAKIE